MVQFLKPSSCFGFFVVQTMKTCGVHRDGDLSLFVKPLATSMIAARSFLLCSSGMSVVSTPYGGLGMGFGSQQSDSSIVSMCCQSSATCEMGFQISDICGSWDRFSDRAPFQCSSSNSLGEEEYLLDAPLEGLIHLFLGVNRAAFLADSEGPVVSWGSRCAHGMSKTAGTLVDPWSVDLDLA